MTLQVRTALITGGGSGIGAETARRLAAEGVRCVIAGRTDAKLAEVAAGSQHITPHVCDVADRDAAHALVAFAVDALGGVDLLVSAAGINVKGRTMAETDPDDWDRVMRVNATGAYNVLAAVLPHMRAKQDGLVVQVSSVAGLRAGLLGGVAYNASKFAMTALGISAAQEVMDEGVRVTNIYPGEVETPILAQRPVDPTPEHRAKMLQPEDVAEAVLFVARLPPRANVLELTIKPTTQAFV